MVRFANSWYSYFHIHQFSRSRGFIVNHNGFGPYIVVGDGADTQYQGSTDYDVTADNEAAFSFLTFGLLSPHASLLVIG